MFFRRKKPQPPEQRESYRHVLGEGNSVRVVLERSEKERLEGTLLNLTIRGAGVRIPTVEGAAPVVTDVLDVTLESEQGAWKINTPGIIRQIKVEGDGSFLYGIEFINLGRLYSQMDDALASYFNRRSRVRAPVDLERPVSASLYSAGHRLLAVAFDLTTRGVGLLVRHAEATPLRVDAAAQVGLRLPGSRKELKGDAFIRQHRVLHEQDVIGLQFDLEQARGFAAHEERIAKYCAQRLAARAAWKEPWCEGQEEEAA